MVRLVKLRRKPKKATNTMQTEAMNALALQNLLLKWFLEPLELLSGPPNAGSRES